MALDHLVHRYLALGQASSGSSTHTHPTNAYSVTGVKVYRNAARRLGIELVDKAVQTQQEARTNLSQLPKGEVDGIVRPASLP